MTPPPFHLGEPSEVSHDYNTLDPDATQEHPYHVLDGNPGNPYHVLENNPGNPYHVLENNPGDGYQPPVDQLQGPPPAALGPADAPMVMVENENREITDWQVPGETNEPSGHPLTQFPFFGWHRGDGPANHNMDMIRSLDPNRQEEPIYASLSDHTRDPQEENPYASLEDVRSQMGASPVDSKRAIKRSKPVDSQSKPQIKKRVTKVPTKK